MIESGYGHDHVLSPIISAHHFTNHDPACLRVDGREIPAHTFVKWDDSGGWLGGFIEEASKITDLQWEYEHPTPKEKKCMFKEG